MNQYSWYMRLIFWLQKRKYGEVLKSAMTRTEVKTKIIKLEPICK